MEHQHYSMFLIWGSRGDGATYKASFWKVSGRSNRQKSPLPERQLDKGKVTRHSAKLRGCAYYNILIPLRQQKKGMDRMISVMDVLMIFFGGFISAKVCDSIRELERGE